MHDGKHRTGPLLVPLRLYASIATMNLITDSYMYIVQSPTCHIKSNALSCTKITIQTRYSVVLFPYAGQYDNGKR